MNLLNIENVSKSYSEKELLTNINLGINEGDKIGIIGINGTGKTTLLKLVVGLEVPDEGRIVKGNSIRIEFLPQNPDYDEAATVLEQIFRGSTPLMELLREYEMAMMNKETLTKEILDLNHRMDVMNAWNTESDAKAILTKLGVVEFHAKIGTLSGGQKKRVALACALINPSDLLILDEPTNHLDNNTIDWLEQYLNKRRGALLMITHDRYFLDRVVNEIIEIDRGRLYEYKGNYSSFLEKKLEREELESAAENKKKSLFKKELLWIRKGAKARTTKQKARIDRFDLLADEITNETNDKLEISSVNTRLGKKVIEIHNIKKSFAGKKIITGFNYIMLRNDRIGIIGPNGSGKSTLINIIAQKLQADEGNIEIGETVKIGLFSQESTIINENLRVIEYIREGAEMIITADGYKISASQMLERFLFPSSLQWAPVSKLSGGEKRRLQLLRVLIEAPNVLLLDEPTNDLDIETLTILEDYLDSFVGAVMAVSHDRYFLDRIAEKIFAFEEPCRIIQYTGNYSDYKEFYIQNIDLSEGINNNGNLKVSESSKSENSYKKDKPLKFSFKEQKEYDEIDSVIVKLEDKVTELDNKISESASDYNLLQKYLEEKKEIEDELEMKMERWIYLNELAERILLEKGLK
jgi:ABC transport system ATP-binding/permease protein